MNTNSDFLIKQFIEMLKADCERWSKEMVAINRTCKYSIALAHWQNSKKYLDYWEKTVKERDIARSEEFVSVKTAFNPLSK